MKVILLQDVEGLGKKYEVKEVKEGHARNLLLPEKLAKPATKEALKWLADQKEVIEKEAEEDLKKANLLDKAHLILQIHDELVYEVEEKVLKDVEKIVENAMETVLERSYLHYKTAIPLEVHFGSGNNLVEVK